MADNAILPPTLEQLLSAPVAAQVVSADEHVKAMGRTHGVRMGAARRAYEISQELQNKAAKLDSLMPFATLLIVDPKVRGADAASVAWIVPPVLSESRGEVATDNGGQSLRLISASYRIEVPPRYVIAVPTWREYVLPALGNLETQSSDSGFVPKSDSQAVAWRAGLQEGWPVGRQLAEKTFAASLEKATNEFRGMTLYHGLYKQGLVTAPIEDTTETPAKKVGDNGLVVGVRTFTIKATSVWNDQPQSWKAFSEKQPGKGKK